MKKGIGTNAVLYEETKNEEFKMTAEEYKYILDKLLVLFKQNTELVKLIEELAQDVQKIEENLGMVKPKPMTEQERNKYIAEHLEEHPEWRYEK